ncbi:hypothetical protein BLNAU_15845 [Blattamonas nauphoetae]|uniref:Uncharacterized protein n=1 Tax=Blattamonas nauphoetae TaxID=2049346 RepID=A0ABQ9XF55_9EUKA|nr:hypothetical protein BLNAU_15845 [Blattamonas nauphoetae]
MRNRTLASVLIHHRTHFLLVPQDSNPIPAITPFTSTHFRFIGMREDSSLLVCGEGRALGDLCSCLVTMTKLGLEDFGWDEGSGYVANIQGTAMSLSEQPAPKQTGFGQSLRHKGTLSGCGNLQQTGASGGRFGQTLHGAFGNQQPESAFGNQKSNTGSAFGPQQQSGGGKFGNTQGSVFGNQGDTGGGSEKKKESVFGTQTGCTHPQDGTAQQMSVGGFGQTTFRGQQGSGGGFGG